MRACVADLIREGLVIGFLEDGDTVDEMRRRHRPPVERTHGNAVELCAQKAHEVMARLVRDKRMTFSRRIRVRHLKGDVLAQARDVSLEEAAAAAERDLVRRVARSMLVDRNLHRHTRRARALEVVAGLAMYKRAYSRGNSVCPALAARRAVSRTGGVETRLGGGSLMGLKLLLQGAVLAAAVMGISAEAQRGVTGYTTFGCTDEIAYEYASIDEACEDPAIRSYIDWDSTIFPVCTVCDDNDDDDDDGGGGLVPPNIVIIPPGMARSGMSCGDAQPRRPVPCGPRVRGKRDRRRQQRLRDVPGRDGSERGQNGMRVALQLSSGALRAKP